MLLWHDVSVLETRFPQAEIASRQALAYPWRFRWGVVLRYLSGRFWGRFWSRFWSRINAYCLGSVLDPSVVPGPAPGDLIVKVLAATGD